MAIADAQRQVVAVRSGETVPMKTPVRESQSNGRVGSTVQRVQGLIRTLKDALEVKRPDILVDGRVVSGIDHKIQGLDVERHKPSVHVRANIQRHIRRVVRRGQDRSGRREQMREAHKVDVRDSGGQSEATRTMTDLGVHAR